MPWGSRTTGEGSTAHLAMVAEDSGSHYSLAELCCCIQLLQSAWLVILTNMNQHSCQVPKSEGWQLRKSTFHSLMERRCLRTCPEDCQFFPRLAVIQCWCCTISQSTELPVSQESPYLNTASSFEPQQHKTDFDRLDGFQWKPLGWQGWSTDPVRRGWGAGLVQPGELQGYLKASPVPVWRSWRTQTWVLHSGAWQEDKAISWNTGSA